MTSCQPDQPYIWFDTEPANHIEHGDCSDCSGACGDDTALLRPSEITPELAQHIRTHQYHITPDLVTQPIDTHHTVVCNPVGDGRISVLNPAALGLLDLFRTPRSFQEAVDMSGQSAAAVQTTMELFVQLGLLDDKHVGVTPPRVAATTLTAWLHVTNACQLRCAYCYLIKTKDAMEHDTARQSVEAVFRSAIRQGFQRVQLKFAGGEPTLNLDVITAAYDYARELAERHGLGLDAIIVSNGIGWKQTTITALAERAFRVIISLDGLGVAHDRQRTFASGATSSSMVMRTIDRLVDAGLVPQISITVSDRNLDELPSLMGYVLERDLPFALNFYRENDCSAAHIDLQYHDAAMIRALELVFDVIEARLPRRSLLGCLVDRANLNNRHQHGCGVGHNYLVIDQHGGVAKCQMDIKQTVTTIAFIDPLQAIKDDRLGIQNLPVDSKEGCRSCQWRYWCAGGCSLLTYRVTGRYDIQSPNCAIYKALYPKVLRLEGLRLIAYTLVWTPTVEACSEEAES